MKEEERNKRKTKGFLKQKKNQKIERKKALFD